MTRGDNPAQVRHPFTMDPACGTVVDSTARPPTARYRDRKYSFCSLECRTAFERNPAAFVARPPHAAVATRHPLGVRTVAAYAAAVFLLVVVLPAVLGLVLGSWLLAFTFVLAALLAALAIAVRFADSGGVRS